MSAQAQLTLRGFRRTVTQLRGEPFELTLFVSGASDASARAVTNIREFCDAYLEGHHHLNIVDLNQEPGAGGEHHVLATPTLVKRHPLPVRMLVGDMSDHLKILLALDAGPGAIRPADDPSASATRTQ